MSAKRDPRAPVKPSPGDLSGHKDYPKLSALVLERGSLGRKLKMERGSIEEAKRLERLVLKDVRTDWFEAVDHDEIKQQLRGEAVSTFTFIKPEFDCPVKKTIPEVFRF